MNQDSKCAFVGGMTDLPGIYFAIVVILPVVKGLHRLRITGEKLNEARNYIQEEMESTGLITTDVFLDASDAEQSYRFIAFFPTTNNSTKMKISMVQRAEVKDVKLLFN